MSAKARKTGDKEPRKGRGIKILCGCLVGVVALAALSWAAFFAYMKIAYSHFYSLAKAEFQMPGIGDGFIPQDMTYSEKGNCWFISGYMGNEEPSPIWRIGNDGSVVEISVFEPSGEQYRQHGGGLAITDERAYLTCVNGFLVFNMDDLLADGNNVRAQAISQVDVGFDPAFINAQDGSLYTGVFYYEGPYDTPEKMHLTAPDGTQNHAVMYAYKLDPAKDDGVAEAPNAVYSIPDKVQGMCINPDGDMVLSASWGLGASTISTYSLNESAPTGSYDVDGKAIDLFFLDDSNLESVLDAPPMMEGIDVFDGRIYLANESASNKYIFGKLYGGATAYSIPATPE